MASTTYHTIEIQNYHHDQRDEAVAKDGADIIPGMLLEFDGGKLDKHGVDAGVVRPILIAVESPTIEPGATASIDTVYEDGETVYFSRAKTGDVYYMLAAHSTGNNYVKGVTPLVSNGDGLVRAYTLSTGMVEGVFVGVPNESLDNSSVSGATARLQVRIA